MPKLSKEERAELEARLAEDDADDDDDDEVEYGNSDGSYWRVKVRHAKRLGLYKVPDPPKPDEADKPPAKPVRFDPSRRRSS